MRSALVSLALCSSLFACVGDVLPGNSDGGDGGPSNDGGGADQSADAGPPVPVKGTVVNLFNEPVANAEVWIGSSKVVTAGDGTFSIDAPPVYDANVVIAGAPQRLMTFVGLTSRAPTLQARDGAVSGTATGAGNVIDSTLTWPPPAGTAVTVTYSTDKGTAFSSLASFSGKNMTVPSFPYGRSATSVNGTAYVVRYSLGNSPTGLPENANATTGVRLAGRNTYQVANGGTAAPAVMLGAAGTDFAHRPMTLAFALPPNTTALEMAALIDVPPDPGRIVIRSTVPAVNNTVFDTPTGIAGALSKSGAAVHARHTDRREIWAWEVGLGAPATINLAPPPPVDLGAPADNATLPANGELSWDGTGRTGAFYFVEIKCSTTFEAAILTTAPKVKLPKAGMTGPSGMCTWGVLAVTPAQDADALVQPAGWFRKLSYESAPQSGTAAQSAMDRHFVVQ